MSCSTLKRRHDFDSFYSSNSAPPKRRRLVEAKRRNINVNRNSNLADTQSSSPFAKLPKPSKEQMETQLKQEIKRLRRRAVFGKENEMEPAGRITHDNLRNSNGGFPSASPVANDHNETIQSTINKVGGANEGANNKEIPLFSFKQVEMICERFVEQREEAIRQEYEQILSTKLAEQYDTFVKFTHDQIRKQFHSSSTPSYLS